MSTENIYQFLQLNFIAGLGSQASLTLPGTWVRIL